MCQTQELRGRAADPNDPDEQEQFRKFWAHVVNAFQDQELSAADAYRLKQFLFTDRFGVAYKETRNANNV